MIRKALHAVFLLSVLSFGGLSLATWALRASPALSWLRSLSLLAALLLFGTLLLRLLVRPTPHSVKTTLWVLAIGAACFFALPALTPLARAAYFRSHRTELETLASLAAAGPIKSYWAADEQWASLNGRFVALTDQPIERTGVLSFDTLFPLDTILRRQGIQRALFDTVRERQRALGILLLYADSGRVALGGRDAGFVYLLPPRPDSFPRSADHLGPRNGVPVERLAERWYYARW